MQSGECMDLFFPSLISFVLGSFVGYCKFAIQFRDSLKKLILEPEVIMFMLASGSISLFAFYLALALNITIAGLSFNEHRSIIAVLVGISAQDLIFSFFPANGNSEKISMSFTSLINNIKHLPFHHYAIKRNKRLLPDVAKLMPLIAYEQLQELISSCFIISKSINDEDCNFLISRIKEITTYYSSNDQKKLDVSLEIAKLLGIDLLTEVANTLQKDEDFSKKLQALDDDIKQIKNLGDNSDDKR